MGGCDELVSLPIREVSSEVEAVGVLERFADSAAKCASTTLLIVSFSVKERIRAHQGKRP